MIRPGQLAPNFSTTTPTGHLDLESLLKEGPVAVFFLRYIGCPISQLRIAELDRETSLFASYGIRPLVIIDSTPQRLETYRKKKREIATQVITDPEHEIYDLYHVKPGGWLTLVYPGSVRAALRATFGGYTHGPFEGKIAELMLPAVFLVDPGRTVRFCSYGRHPGDSPPSETILESCRVPAVGPLRGSQLGGVS